MLKLKIYKFLGKFIPYFNLKFHKMSFIKINQEVRNILNGLSYFNVIERVTLNDPNNRNFKILYNIELNHQPYYLNMLVEYKDFDVKPYEYNIILNKGNFCLSSNNITTLTEITNIDSNMQSIKTMLKNTFSLIR